MQICKPTPQDINAISEILTQWTDPEEVDKYISRISDEMNGISEYGMQFWTIKDENHVVGVGGLADILPKIRQYSETNNPIEIKILYLNKNQRGRGLGKIFLEFLEKLAREQGREEVLIRSATRYRDTAWGFYEKFGYLNCGTVDADMAVFRKRLCY